MEDVRLRILKAEPALDIEFTQMLQDMIGDLSNSPGDDPDQAVLQRCTPA